MTTHNAVDELVELKSQRDELLKALKGLSAMYASAWDCVDGGLMMMESSVGKFEAAHAIARAAIARCRK